MNFNLAPVTLADGMALGPVSFQQRTEIADRAASGAARSG
jgi:hypothetical protein